MNNAKLCLCLVVAVLTVHLIECRGGRGGGHGGGRGHSGHGHGGGGGWFSGWGKRPSSQSTHQTYPGHGGYSGYGTGGSHTTYPKSPGYSGHGTGGSHSYPSTYGLSGSGRGYGPSRPAYYSSPQHVYVTQYREAQSPYSDLLTGLTFYNLGRSHNYHHHYYSDDYYRQSSSGGSYSSVHNRGTEYQDNTVDGSKEEAKCVLKIKKDGKEEVLKIPCAIISTFDDGNRTSNGLVNNTLATNCTSVVNTTLDKNSGSFNETNLNSTLLGNNTVLNPCNGTVNVTDPLSVTGAPIAPTDATSMECSVEIRTKKEVIHNNVDCSTLLKYAKMSVPQDKVSDILPHRETLKSMLDKPPWWMSLFIAV